MSYEKQKEFGLDFQQLQADEGKLGAEKLPAAIDYLGDEKEPVEDRIIVAKALGTYAAMVPEPTKLPAFKNAVSNIGTTLKKILLTEDDNDNISEYDDKGIQTIGYELANACQSVNLQPMKNEWNLHFMPTAFDVMEAAGDVALKAPTPLRSTGPAVVRANTIQALIGCAPNIATAFQGGWTIGDVDNPVPILNKFVKDDTPANLKTYASQLLRSIAQYDKGKMKGAGPMAESVIKRVLSGDMQAPQQLTMDMYAEEPDVFHQYFGQIINASFLQCSHLCSQIAQKNGQALVQYVPQLVQLFASGSVPHNMDMMVLQILNPIAEKVPAAVYPHLDAIQKPALEIKYCDTIYCQMLGHVGQDPAYADAVMDRLGRCMSKVSSDAKVLALTSMLNLIPKISSVRILDPYMDEVRACQGKANALVEKIEDAYQGRSLANAYDRLDALEEMVLEMNSKVAETCANFEDVKAYVDKNIAEVKDFVGEVVKKLPQPTKLTVVKGLRKTIRLHFACVRTGTEWTCDTKAWGKWMKMGFSLLKLGKCALDIGMGNPLGLVKTGIDACKGIYDAFKEKDDKDFDTYIQQPFLTSEERDKLINQLREGGFFELHAYDAQLGGWVRLDAVSKDDADALVAKRDKNKPGADAKQTVKGKNFGLGSARDIAAAAGAVASKVGLGSTLADKAGGSAGGAMEMAGVNSESASAAGSKVGAIAESKLASEDDPAKVSYHAGAIRRPQEQKSAGKSSAMNDLIARRAAGGAATSAIASSSSTRPVGGLRERMSELEAQMEAQKRAMEEQQKSIDALAATVQTLKDRPQGACCAIL